MRKIGNRVEDDFAIKVYANLSTFTKDLIFIIRDVGKENRKSKHMVHLART